MSHSGTEWWGQTYPKQFSRSWQLTSGRYGSEHNKVLSLSASHFDASKARKPHPSGRRTRMGAAASAVRIRHELHTRLINARKRTDEIFHIVREDAIYDRPIAERHRIIFYIGHVEAFDWNLLAQRAFGLQSFHPSFDQLFSFGIDPVGGGLPTDQASDWPQREEVDQYNHRLRNELDTAIARAMRHAPEGHPQLAEMLEVAVEHRLMHAETLAYMLHQLPPDRKIPAGHEPVCKTPRAKSHLLDIPAGRA